MTMTESLTHEEKAWKPQAPQPTVVFASDDNNAMLLGIALCSLFENKQGTYPIDVYVIDGGISAANKQRLRSLETTYGFAIAWIVPDNKEFEGMTTSSYPAAGLYRLAIARLLPTSCKRVLYLDSDVVVVGDLADLFNFDLEDKLAGAVTYESADERKHLKHISGIDGSYFNAGVLLIDLTLWRTLDTETRLFNFFLANLGCLKYLDQDVLNVVLSGNWKEIGREYNYIPEAVGLPDRRLIIHFAGSPKPWYFFSARRHHEDYNHYANKTPWRFLKYRLIMDRQYATRIGIYSFASRMRSIFKRSLSLSQRALYSLRQRRAT